jgi:peroxiredoxin
MRYLISFILLLSLQFNSFAHYQAPFWGYKIGEQVADFNLKNIDGKMISLSQFTKAKAIVLIFTCNHCPFSIAYEDRIIALDKVFRKKGVQMVLINPNDPSIEAAKEDSFDEMKKRANEKKFNFPYLFDEKQEVFPRFGATKTPDCFIVKPRDKSFVLAYRGAFDNNKETAQVTEKYLENALNAILAGKSPNPAETKAFGCSIKCNDKSKLGK